ncbi:MAG: RpiB/LacA/LacB family sugar-phosphate isomerase [Patescibacteria group bacterium]
MLYIISDHRGFELKEKIKQYLSNKGIEFEDLGAFEYIQGDDYPDYAKKLAEKILAGKENLGVALCGSGAGMTIALNRFRGVFAGLAANPKMARANKQEDNINVLVLPANFIDEKTALESVNAFLIAEFDNAERRIRRLKKIEELN